MSKAKPAGRKTKVRDYATVNRFLEMLHAGSDLRAGKVKRLRRSVRQRRYENELKLSIAVDRLARELAV